MKVLGMELSDWTEFETVWSRERKNPLAYILFYKHNNLISTHSKFRHLERLFYQTYSEEYTSKLSADQMKELVDQFLETINKMELFL